MHKFTTHRDAKIIRAPRQCTQAFLFVFLSLKKLTAGNHKNRDCFYKFTPYWNLNIWATVRRLCFYCFCCTAEKKPAEASRRRTASKSRIRDKLPPSISIISARSNPNISVWDPKNTNRSIYKPLILQQTSVSPLRWMDPEMDPTKPENDSQSKSREQTVQTSDSQPRYNPSITFHSLRNDLLMTPRGALITPIQARVSRDTSDGNVISRAQSPCDSLTHIIRSSLCSEFNADTSYICEHTHTHTATAWLRATFRTEVSQTWREDAV